MPIRNLACARACVHNIIMIIDITPGTAYLLVDVSDMDNDMFDTDVVAMGGVFLFGSDPVGPADSDLFLEERVWLSFVPDDLVIFKLKYGARIRAQLSVQQMTDALNLIEDAVPGYNIGRRLAALASAVAAKRGTWSSYLRIWAQEMKRTRLHNVQVPPQQPYIKSK